MTDTDGCESRGCSALRHNDCAAPADGGLQTQHNNSQRHTLATPQVVMLLSIRSMSCRKALGLVTASSSMLLAPTAPRLLPSHPQPKR
jgi:hypothetical protein